MTEAVCRVVTLLALLSGLVLAIAAPFAVVIFFGSAFAESAWAVWLLLPGIVTFSIARVLSMYLLGRDRLRVDLLASFIGLVVTLVLDLVLIPRFGFRGAAVASTIAYTCTMAVDLRWVVRNSTMSLERMLIARPDDLSLLVRRVRQSISRG
jgi:O-antigen/teichoic acid export membrane protein